MTSLVATSGTRVQHQKRKSHPSCRAGLQRCGWDKKGSSDMKASARPLQISPNRYVCTGEIIVSRKAEFIQMPPDLCFSSSFLSLSLVSWTSRNSLGLWSNSLHSQGGINSSKSWHNCLWTLGETVCIDSKEAARKLHKVLLFSST